MVHICDLDSQGECLLNHTFMILSARELTDMPVCSWVWSHQPGDTESPEELLEGNQEAAEGTGHNEEKTHEGATHHTEGTMQCHWEGC